MVVLTKLVLGAILLLASEVYSLPTPQAPLMPKIHKHHHHHHHSDHVEETQHHRTKPEVQESEISEADRQAFMYNNEFADRMHLAKMQIVSPFKQQVQQLQRQAVDAQMSPEDRAAMRKNIEAEIRRSAGHLPDADKSKLTTKFAEYLESRLKPGSAHDAPVKVGHELKARDATERTTIEELSIANPRWGRASAETTRTGGTSGAGAGARAGVTYSIGGTYELSSTSRGGRTSVSGRPPDSARHPVSGRPLGAGARNTYAFDGRYKAGRVSGPAGARTVGIKGVTAVHGTGGYVGTWDAGARAGGSSNTGGTWTFTKTSGAGGTSGIDGTYAGRGVRGADGSHAYNALTTIKKTSGGRNSNLGTYAVGGTYTIDKGSGAGKTLAFRGSSTVGLFPGQDGVIGKHGPYAVRGSYTVSETSGGRGGGLSAGRGGGISEGGGFSEGIGISEGGII